MPRSDIVRQAMEFGRQKGFVTFGELNQLFLNELWTSTMTAPEDIEAAMAALSDAGIDVIEDERP